MTDQPTDRLYRRTDRQGDREVSLLKSCSYSGTHHKVEDTTPPLYQEVEVQRPSFALFIYCLDRKLNSFIKFPLKFQRVHEVKLDSLSLVLGTKPASKTTIFFFLTSLLIRVPIHLTLSISITDLFPPSLTHSLRLEVRSSVTLCTGIRQHGPHIY